MSAGSSYRARTGTMQSFIHWPAQRQTQTRNTYHDRVGYVRIGRVGLVFVYRVDTPEYRQADRCELGGERGRERESEKKREFKLD